MVGLTKQGVLHYFPSRAALDEALLFQALSRIDEEMATAVRDGCAAETYLRLAAPSREERAAALVMATMMRRGQGNPLPSAVHEAIERWEAMIAEELGDPVRARVVRLVGDGLFGESLVTGTPPTADRLLELITHLIPDARGSRA